MDKTSQSVRIGFQRILESWSGKFTLKRGSAGIQNTKHAPKKQHGLAQPRANVVSTCSMVWKMLR